MPSAAPTKLPQGLLERLDGLATRALQNWAIPGLALAIVRPGEDTIVRTYGVRDTATGAGVTPRTQFHTCSLTKSFTAAGLLLLLEEHGLQTTAKVKDLLPGFRMSDAAVTEQVTLRDLLCHASGLPRHDKIWTPGDLDRAQMLERLPHLALSCGLRERYQYNNLGYVALAAVTERLSGMPWEDHTALALLRPLGFRDFSFTPAGLEAAGDHAHPHPRQGASVYRGRHWPAPAPAGGLNACVEDMALWVRFLLGEPLPGVAQERTQRMLEAMTTPWIYTAKSTHAEIGHCHYGLGVACERYRGRRHVAHTGGMPGWSTLFSLLPDERIGIVVLTNREPTPVPLMLAFALYDAICGLEPVDWYSRLAEARRDFLAKEVAEQAESARAAPSVPNRELQEYAGSYRNAAYGTLQVEAGHGALAWSWRGLSGTMEPSGEDRFVLRETHPPRHQEPLVASFQHEAGQGIVGVTMPLQAGVADIEFRRVLNRAGPAFPW